jgi:hypothetical protein
MKELSKAILKKNEELMPEIEMSNLKDRVNQV